MKNLLIVLTLASLLTACHQETQQQNNVSASKVLKVKVAPVEVSQEQKTLTYSGTIEASQTIPLTFQSMEKVTAIYVDEGDFVKQGQLLAKADNRSVVSAYQAALAKYDQAIDARDRLKKVYDAGSLPEIKWVDANSKVAQAEANRDHYKKSLENCELRAPTDGFIGARNIEVGMSAVQIQSAIKLVKIESVAAKISVPESEISLFEKGHEAILHVSALNNSKYTGQVEKVGVVANRLSRTYDVKVEVKNTDLKLKPGMVCKVEVIFPFSNPVLLVPMTAVNSDANNKPFVFTVDRNTKKAHKKTIHIASIVNNKIAVSSGLEADELVIVMGNQKVSNNTEVSW